MDDDIVKLKNAILLLKKSIIEFPIGAVTLDDYKPIDEKIRDSRNSILCLNSRIHRLRAQTTLRSVPDPPPHKSHELASQLQDKLSNCIISNNLLTAVQQSSAVEDIVFHDKADPEIRTKTKAVMSKLLSLNDTAMKLHYEFNEIYLNKEFDLKDKCAQKVTEYSEFLRKQEGIRNANLAKTNPEVAAKKEKLLKTIYKINTMKRLITNFISTASPQLRENTDLCDMLKKHRDLVRLETITEMAQSIKESKN